MIAARQPRRRGNGCAIGAATALLARIRFHALPWWQCPRLRRRAPTLAAFLGVLAATIPVVEARGQEDLSAVKNPAQDRLNIVLILADDLGWSDLGCHGADLHETPHLDALAAGGLRFTTAYAPAPVCSPTRAALLTGRAPARLGMTTWSEAGLASPDDRRLRPAASLANLPHAEQTLAEYFQAAGYLTALVGKWHLGDADHAPETQGFDINIGGTRWGAPASFFWPYRGAGRLGGEFRYVPHLEFGSEGEYLTDRLGDEAVRVIDRATERSKPFFLFLSHHAPHTPIEAKPPDRAYFEAKLRPSHRQRNPVYAAMIRSLDDSVGRVMDRLQSLGLMDKTVIIFTSDNGGYVGTDRRQSMAVASNAPLRSGKGSLYEGGLRVPLIVRWPGRTRPGSLCRTAVILTDLFHTLRPLAGGTAGRGDSDGVDLAALLAHPEAALSRDSLFFHFPHYYHEPATTPASAIRSGNWKLIEHLEDGRVELYDLQADVGESHDRAADQPDRARDLQSRLAAWRAAVGAHMPVPSPAAARPDQ
jgi:arylsulfatase A-like enzyme